MSHSSRSVKPCSCILAISRLADSWRESIMALPHALKKALSVVIVMSINPCVPVRTLALLLAMDIVILKVLQTRTVNTEYPLCASRH